MVKRLLQALVLCLVPGISQAATVAISEPVAELVSSTDTTSYAMTAYTPTANSIQVVYVFASGTVAAGTMTGGSLTWIKAGSVASNGGADTTYVFYARVGASPASTAPTFDCTGDAATGVVLTAFQLTGVHWANPLRQLKTGAATAANPSVTMNIALKTGNGYTVGAQVPRNPATYTPPASWTEIADTGHTTPTKGAEAAFRAGGETGTTVTLTGASGAYGMIVAEWNQGFDICGNMIDDDFTGGDLACPSPDGDNDGYTTDGSGAGDDFDCDDTDRRIPAVPWVMTGCSGGQAKLCNTATGVYGSCTTPTIETGTQYYINFDTGTDGGACSFASPCKTFLQFVSYFDPGDEPTGYHSLAAADTVWFLGGTDTSTYLYDGNTMGFFLRGKNGTSGDHITLIAPIGSTSKLSPTVCDGTPTCTPMTLETSSYIDVFGLELTHGFGTNARLEGGGLASDGDNSKVVGAKIHDNNGPNSENPCGLNIAQSPSGWTISHNLIYDNWDTAAGVNENERGICLFGGTGNAVNRNVIYNTRVKSDANNAAGCLVWKHGSDAATNEIAYNVLWNCFQTAIGTNNSGTHIHHNRVFDSDRGIFVQDFAGTHYDKDELIEYNTFVNAGFFELNPDISSGSPEINTMQYNIYVDQDSSYGSSDSVVTIYEFGTDAHYTTWFTGGFYVIDANCYYNSAGTALRFGLYESTSGAQTLGSSHTFATWQGTAGFDANSFVEDPLLNTYHQATAANCDEWGWSAPTGGGGGGAQPLLLNAIEED